MVAAVAASACGIAAAGDSIELDGSGVRIDGILVRAVDPDFVHYAAWGDEGRIRLGDVARIVFDTDSGRARPVVTDWACVDAIRSRSGIGAIEAMVALIDGQDEPAWRLHADPADIPGPRCSRVAALRASIRARQRTRHAVPAPDAAGAARDARVHAALASIERDLGSVRCVPDRPESMVDETTAGESPDPAAVPMTAARLAAEARRRSADGAFVDAIAAWVRCAVWYPESPEGLGALEAAARLMEDQVGDAAAAARIRDGFGDAAPRPRPGGM